MYEKEKAAEGLPATTADAGNGSKMMKAGPHVLKITNIFTTIKGKEIKDSEGFPGISIQFENKEKAIITKTFYYSTSKDQKCKSEFMLTRLKIAIGLDGKKSADGKSVIGKKLWAAVGEKIHVDAKTGKPIYNKAGYPVTFSELYPDFFPFALDKPCPFEMFDEESKLLAKYRSTYVRALKDGESLTEGKKSEAHANEDDFEEAPESQATEHEEKMPAVETKAETPGLDAENW